MAKRLKWLRGNAERGKRLLIILTLVATILSIRVILAKASFTFAPTLDLTTSSNITGATAVYTFHIESPDSLEAVSAYSVTIPAGYSIDPTYLTTTPNIELPGFAGAFGYIGLPPFGSIKVKTTTTSGQFNVYGYIPFESLVGNVVIAPPTPITPGVINGLITIWSARIYVDLTVTVINPSTPGVYTWAPNAATPWSGGANVSMDPRPGFTNQVEIVAVPVEGHLLPMDKLAVLTPYITRIGIMLVGLIGAVSVAYVTLRKRRT